MLHRLLHTIMAAAIALTSLTACVTEDVAPNTRYGNFSFLWQTLDQRYCFFDLKARTYGLDWNEVHTRYAARISEKMDERQLFSVLAEMCNELRDGHVNLVSSFNTSRYGAWYDDYPTNYADTLERIYLGRAEDYYASGGLKFRVLADNIGYVRCATFDTGMGDGSLNEMIRTLMVCDGLIIDVRSNGGGRLTTAQKLASLFLNEPTVCGYQQHKTGTGHNDLSAPEAVVIDPFPGLRWQKPAVILTNRRTYSAANAFVMYVKGLDHVTILGDRTGGGAGLPFQTDLPNGWAIRFSACPSYDRHMTLTEEGIDPDIRQDLLDDDLQRGTDTLIEAARRLLRAKQ